MTGSAYVIMQSMDTQEFARSPLDTVAMFMLSEDEKARFEFSKSLKSACSKAGSVCKLVTTKVLVQDISNTNIWVSSKIIAARIIKAGDKNAKII